MKEFYNDCSFRSVKETNTEDDNTYDDDQDTSDTEVDTFMSWWRGEKFNCELH